MTNLIIGMGQIGTAILTILSEKYEVEGIDIKDCYQPKHEKYDFVHICFPCKEQEQFVKDVAWYQKNYLAPDGVTIIHSTVPVGTSRMCNAVNSPCRGVHPSLYEGIKTFTKFFGCIIPEQFEHCKKALRLFEGVGINCLGTSSPENTEALKLWDTTVYGVNIILEKAIWEYCQEKGLDFRVVYTLARETYNEGFEKLGMTQFRQYNLSHMDGAIGGHCIVPNAKLLNHWIGEMILAWQEDHSPKE